MGTKHNETNSKMNENWKSKRKTTNNNKWTSQITTFSALQGVD